MRGKRNYDLGGCSQLLARISSVKTGCIGAAVETKRAGGAIQGIKPMQGISPLDESAGAAEWQTLRFPRKERPSLTVRRVNEAMGARAVKANTTRSMNVTFLMCVV